MQNRKIHFRFLSVGCLAVLLLGSMVSAAFGAASGMTPRETVTLDARSVILNTFSVRAKPRGKAKVNWETGSEIVVVGFHVWRANKKNGKYTQVNAELIDAENPGGISGWSYTFTDKKLIAGKTYFYKLQVVKVSSPNEWSEIVRITAKP
mgnify:FL=1